MSDEYDFRIKRGDKEVFAKKEKKEKRVGDTPNCAKCKWSRIDQSDEKEAEPAGMEVFFGIRIATHKGRLVCLAHGGCACTAVHDRETCRTLYEVDAVRVAEMAMNKDANG